jgi:D-alanyl-lipoteichoic acid acyltransferase DltB (MBOAT superfamily)
VSFFPQLVAGPIERATNLLPQFYRKRKLTEEEAIKGVKQIIWGLFKKIVVADTCAQYANEIFNNNEQYNSLTLVLGAVYFSFQIYCDFSGYSDIAIGTARLFGFDLMKNFSFPYFSRDVAEFWRRWHISLSTWFRDYVYIPLGGSGGTLWSKIINTFVIFLLSGFWHGPNWTFIVWGGLNAFYFLPLLIGKRNRKHTKEIVAHNKMLPSLREASGMLVTYLLILFAWIFFRAENLNHAWDYIIQISLMDFGLEKIGLERYSFEALLVIVLLLIFEWVHRTKDFPFDGHKKDLIAMTIILVLIILFGNYSDMNSFIYFQF